MPRSCSICGHADRSAIDKALVSGTPLRDIAGQFGLSRSAIDRHKKSCLVDQLARAEKVIRTRKTQQRPVDPKADRQAVKLVEQLDDASLDVMSELKSQFRHMKKLLRACDEYLTDPDDPTRYDLGPRAHEVMVSYEVEEGRTRSDAPIIKRRKAALQKLIDRLEHRETGIGTVTLVEHKSADPRKLIIDTTDQLKRQNEMLAKLISQLDERPQINFLVVPEWLALRSELVKALRPFPEARAAVAHRMKALRAGPLEA